MITYTQVIKGAKSLFLSLIQNSHFFCFQNILIQFIKTPKFLQIKTQNQKKRTFGGWLWWISEDVHQVDAEWWNSHLWKSDPWHSWGEKETAQKKVFHSHLHQQQQGHTFNMQNKKRNTHKVKTNHLVPQFSCVCEL